MSFTSFFRLVDIGLIAVTGAYYQLFFSQTSFKSAIFAMFYAANS